MGEIARARGIVRRIALRRRRLFFALRVAEARSAAHGLRGARNLFRTRTSTAVQSHGGTIAVRRIAHLSDVHILDARQQGRGARYKLATTLVGVGRNGRTPADRARRLASALALGKAQGADHFVVSGDLTELGEDAEFEQFAEVLHEARLAADSVTLVPGNHDAYSSADAWKRAMRGPLARFSTSSAMEAGKVVDRESAAFLPIDTSRYQSIARSSGVFTKDAAEAITKRLSDPAFADRPTVLVLHHPPFHPVKALSWLDGLRGGNFVLDLLARFPKLQLLHGHLHRIFDHILATSTAASARAMQAGLLPYAQSASSVPRLFGAPATCEGTAEAPRMRFYDVTPAGLRAYVPSVA